MKMRKPKPDLYNGACPSRKVLQLLGSKWSMLLVCILKKGPLRTGELMRRIDGISQKMLTQTLRDLERHGIVERIDYAEVPPRVEYRLTRMGYSLSALMQQIEHWVLNNYARMNQAANAFKMSE